VDGTEVDQAYWTVLTRCGKAGLPTDLILSFPAVVRDGEQGLKAWKHLFERVFLVTDASIAALQRYFDNPPSAKQGAQLLGLLNRWINLVEELEDAGCSPWDPAKRSSLEKTYSGVESARRAAEALEALYDVVPVDKLLETLMRVAVKQASAEQKTKELGMYSGGEAQDSASQDQGRQERTGRCKWHDAGGCRFGETCRFWHVGEPGNGHKFEDKRARPRRESRDKAEVTKLRAELAAMAAERAPTPLPKKDWCVNNDNNRYAPLSYESDSELQQKAGKLELTIKPELRSSIDSNRPQPNRAARSLNWRKPSVQDTLVGPDPSPAPPNPVCNIPAATAVS
jgi:hypothetical protein